MRNRVSVRVRVRVRIRVRDRVRSGFDYFRHCAICIAPNTESLVAADLSGTCKCAKIFVNWGHPIDQLSL